MPWIQIKLTTSSAHAEQIETLLLEHNAYSVTNINENDEPLFEHRLGESPIWENLTIIALFDQTIDSHSIIETIKKQLPQQAIKNIRTEKLEDNNWQTQWMSYFKPIQFDENLWVCPSWEKAPNPKATNIIIDPGLAFGTGSHETTSLCLQWLARQKNLHDKTIIDYGCGSGILGIAAAFLGAKHVIAVDIDPKSLEVTKENATLNQITTQQLLTKLPNEMAQNKSHILIANILSGTLIELAETLVAHIKNEGHIVLSGILTEQKEQVLSIYNQWFDFNTIEYKNDWVLMAGQLKKNTHNTPNNL